MLRKHCVSNSQGLKWHDQERQTISQMCVKYWVGKKDKKRKNLHKCKNNNKNIKINKLMVLDHLYHLLVQDDILTFYS